METPTRPSDPEFKALKELEDDFKKAYVSVLEASSKSLLKLFDTRLKQSKQLHNEQPNTATA